MYCGTGRQAGEKVNSLHPSRIRPREYFMEKYQVHDVHYVDEVCTIPDVGTLICCNSAYR